jgi:hypothetical protein
MPHPESDPPPPKPDSNLDALKADILAAYDAGVARLRELAARVPGGNPANPASTLSAYLARVYGWGVDHIAGLTDAQIVLFAEQALSQREAERHVPAASTTIGTQTGPNPKPAADDAANVFRLSGGVWHIQYRQGQEAGDFPDRRGGALRHLARLLAEPGRRFGALEFFPAPAGATPLPYLGRDASSDDRAYGEYEKELERLTREIKEADDAHDTETAGKLREQFNALSERVGGEMAARRRRRGRKCGTPSAGEKADQALRMALKRLKGSLRKKGLPRLADHLDKYLDNAGGQWWYVPPPGTLPWHVTLPDPVPER